MKKTSLHLKESALELREAEEFHHCISGNYQNKSDAEGVYGYYEEKPSKNAFGRVHYNISK